MAEISLTVTRKVIAYARGEHEGEKQIAYSTPSADIADVLSAVTSSKEAKVTLGGFVTLVVADRGAIWRAHNSGSTDDFDALYSLLAQHPSRKMRFLCELVD